MPLQHLPNEAQPLSPLVNPPASQPTRETPLASTDGPRYDAQAVQEILALAEQMQTRHRETLTPEQVEALGQEVGVEREFIRRALAQVESRMSTGDRAHRGNESASWRARLTRPQRALLIIPVALYLALLPFTLEWCSPGLGDAGLTEILLYLIVPTVLAFYLGGSSKSRRVGALTGALTGLAAVLSLLIHTTYGHHYTPPLSEQVTWLTLWLAAGAALGASGAVVDRLVRRPRRRAGRRLRV